MNYYKITIQYEGSRYAGLQWQTGLKTIQDEINKGLALLVGGKISTMTASRTDTGVHALEQIVKITTEHSIDCSEFLTKFNQVLPPDIHCLMILECPGSFRPNLHCQRKEYRYFFTNKKQANLDDKKFIANISNKLDMDKINHCLKSLLGEHDFCNFYSSGSNVKSTIRTITLCELTMINPHDTFSSCKLFKIPENITNCYQLRIEGDGFLKQMIRHIVSALWMVGSGKLSVESFLRLLNGPKVNKQHWKVAPPNGLFLYRINY